MLKVMSAVKNCAFISLGIWDTRCAIVVVACEMMMMMTAMVSTVVVMLKISDDYHC